MSESGAAAAGVDVIGLVATLDALELRPAAKGPTTLVLEDVDALRALTVVGIDRLPSTHVRLVVDRYRVPLAAWRGQLGRLAGLLSQEVTWPAKATGRVTVEVRLRSPLDLSSVAAAVVEMLVPANTTWQWGSPLVAVASGTSVDVLALLAQPGATRPQIEPEPGALLGNDILLAPPGRSVDEVQYRYRVEVGHGPVLDGAGGPLIDLRVHNPIGRLGRVRGEVPNRAAALVEHGDTWELLVAGEVAACFDARSSVPSKVVESLRPCSTLDVSALPEPTDTRESAMLAGRLAELAATGVVLHGGAHLVPHVPQLAQGVRDVMARPRAATAGLANLALSVSQRRAAMRAHAGVLELGRATERLGAPRFLPHVSVLLVTNRPDLVQEAVQQMVAQTYPHLDVLVAVHGHPCPDTSTWTDEQRAIVSEFVEVDATTVFGDVLALATERAQGPLVLKVDDDDKYGREFVWDLVLARLFSGAQVVGKQAEFTYIEPFDVTVHRGFGVEKYNEQVAGGTMLMSVADIAHVGGWRGVPRSVDRALMQRILKAGGLMYVDRGVGFVYVRHSLGHTWNADAAGFLRNVSEQWSGLYEPALG